LLFEDGSKFVGKSVGSLTRAVGDLVCVGDLLVGEVGPATFEVFLNVTADRDTGEDFATLSPLLDSEGREFDELFSVCRRGRNMRPSLRILSM
jgi:hypothetical protein